MTQFVVTDAKITINAVNLSAWIIEHDLPREQELQDKTAYGATTRTFMPGLLNHSFTITGLQDYAGGGPDATLSALFGNTGFAINVKSTSAANSATNPEMQGNYVLETYNPMSGKIGERATFSATFKPAGALTRATA